MTCGHEYQPQHTHEDICGCHSCYQVAYTYDDAGTEEGEEFDDYLLSVLEIALSRHLLLKG